MTTTPTSISEALGVRHGVVDLSTRDSAATPGLEGGKPEAKAVMKDIGDAVAELQERLYAESRGGGTRSVLLVLQGMDTSGKGGIVKHSLGMLDPQGVHLHSFKAPTKEELAHDFLWRIEKQVPTPGIIGIFDRSHYEDVLIVRVHGLAPADEIERRYGAINDFEKKLVDSGTTVIKCMLHISYEKQRERLLARLYDPTKHWKYNPGDVDERARWKDYVEAYEIALGRCSTDAAPWYVVPSDRKWYRNWAITALLCEQLTALNPQYPKADFDIETEKARVAAT
jgi:PPK2 family polyphosphate:nucleotide phosphotransferase